MTSYIQSNNPISLLANNVVSTSAVKAFWKYTGHKYRLTIALFLSMLIFTALGFFVSSIPFAVAYIPILLAALYKSSRKKLCCLSGHFIWPAIIAGWGLIQLGHSTWIIAPAFMCLAMLVSCALLKTSVGIGVLLLAAIPFFPASPLLISGDIFPNTGLLGLVIFAGALYLIETRKTLNAKLVIITSVLTVSCLLRFDAISAQFDSDFDTISASKIHQFEHISTSDIQAITKMGHWRGLEELIPNNTTAILGENIFAHGDIAARSFWCRTARSKNAQIYIGVRGEHDIGEVWAFDDVNCLNPRRIYAAQVGIPNVTGFWTPNVPSWRRWLSPSQSLAMEHTRALPAWIACFEGFSIFRWVGVALSKAPYVVVIANDKWTEPLNVGVLRRKASKSFSNLFNIDVIHADTGRNLLVHKAGDA